jgi:hypothetical protein
MGLHRLYIDTHILVQSFEDQESPSGVLVRLASRGVAVVVESDFLIDEVERVFTRLYGEPEGRNAVRQLHGFPVRLVVTRADWGPSLAKVDPHLRDLDDGPHFAAALAGAAEVIVSTNRRSIRRPMFNLVPLASPEDVVSALAGEGAWPTVEDLRGRWERWARGSPRGPY